MTICFWSLVSASKWTVQLEASRSATFKGAAFGPGVDGTLDGFGIPLHVNQDGDFLAGRGMPFAMPGTGERMSFLRPGGNRNSEQGEKTQPKNRSSAHDPSSWRTDAILYGGAAPTQGRHR